MQTEVTKGKFKACYFQGASDSSGWTADYWAEFFESDNSSKFFIDEPSDPLANRMFIRSGNGQHCIFYLTEEAESSMYD